MDAAFTSTLLINTRLRSSAAGLQSELSQRQVELSSGKKFDPGLELGALSEHLVQIKRQIQTIEQTQSVNGLLKSRLEVMQDAMGGMVGTAQQFVNQVMAESSAQLDFGLLRTIADTALNDFTGYTNTNYRGEYVFSGINTDIPALTNYDADPASAARTAVQAAFQTEFGFAVGDPQAADISADDIRSFLDGAFSDLFDDANWQALWSGSSSRGMRVKYSVSQVTELGVNAHDGAFRETVAAMVAVLEFSDTALNANAMQEVSSYAYGKASLAISQMANLQGEVGVIEERVTDASERMQFQQNVLRNGAAAMEEADSTETATRINELLVRLEASYLVASRLQSLSIMQYI